VVVHKRAEGFSRGHIFDHFTHRDHSFQPIVIGAKCCEDVAVIDERR